MSANFLPLPLVPNSVGVCPLFEGPAVVVLDPEAAAVPVPEPLAEEPDEPDALPVPAPLADEPDESEEAGWAQAMPLPVKTAAPTPRATARPPIRPIYLEAFIAFPCVDDWHLSKDLSKDYARRPLVTGEI